MMASEGDVSEEVIIPARGRTRSGAMHGDVDDEINSDLDILTATLEGREPPAVPTRRSSGASATTSSAKPSLSKKTIATLTKLDVATATPAELLGEGEGRHGKVETEEEAEERAMADAERRKLRATEVAAAATAPASAGPGSAAPAVAGVRTLKGGADKEYDIMVKLLLLGDGGVGKTSLMLRYSEDKFSTSLLATAGVDYKTQFLEIESKRVKCQIWDTAGQQRFHTITQAYYKAAHGIVLIYDVSDATESSFNNVRYWMENITKHANVDCPRILIGNKVDVKGKKVDHARGKALADEFGMKFFETSAKDGTGVREAFHTIARDVVAKMLSGAVPLDGPAGAVKHVKGGSDGKKGDKDCVIQ